MGDERNTLFPAFHSREALTVIGTGKARRGLLARSPAPWPGTRSEKELMKHILLASLPTDCMATLCPTIAQTPKAENILKTKGQKRPFSPTKPEKILKRRQL
jgi:hypothetical protein